MLSSKFELLQKNYDLHVRKECDKSRVFVRIMLSRTF